MSRVQFGRWLLIAALVGLWAEPRLAFAQAAWEYSPYEVRIWIAASPQVELPKAALEELSHTLARRAESVFGAVWNAQVELSPPPLRDDLLAGRPVTDERLKAVSPEVLKADKLFVVAVLPEGSSWRTIVREFDVRSRQWGEPIHRTAAGVESLTLAAWDAIAQSFTPVTRIEMVEGAQITARLRAGGLIVDPASSALVEPGAVLQPILRRNDRAGEPAQGGIQAIPWTLLSVNQRSDSLLTCELHSGYRAAIPTRGGLRMERLALLVRPIFPATKLVLQSRSTPPRPLVGYEVHSRLASEKEALPVGTSDWQGAIDLPAADGTLRIFVIKSGNQPLARLPIVPGQAAELDASISDDDIRLQAEGAVAALHSRALDLVARRELLAARFRARLKEQKFDEAQLLLDEYRKLETRLDLGRALDEQQQKLRTTDKLNQIRIDKLITDARKLLLLKPLADDLVNVLASELVKAKAGAATTPTSAPAAAAAK